MLVPAVAFLMALSVSFVMMWVKESACNGFTHSLTHIVVRMSRIINGLWRPSYPLSSAVFLRFHGCLRTLADGGLAGATGFIVKP